MLPAHGQATITCLTEVTSTPTELSVQSVAGGPSSDLDGIGIYFDGCSTLSILAEDDPNGSADLIGFFDVDTSDPDVFDNEEHTGVNWVSAVYSSPLGEPYKSDVPEGTHSIQVTRVGGPNDGVVFTISFTITVVNISDGNEMTMSNVTAGAN